MIVDVIHYDIKMMFIFSNNDIKVGEIEFCHQETRMEWCAMAYIGMRLGVVACMYEDNECMCNVVKRERETRN